MDMQQLHTVENEIQGTTSNFGVSGNFNSGITYANAKRQRASTGARRPNEARNGDELGNDEFAINV